MVSTTAAVFAAAGVWLLPPGETPPLSTFLFWIALLIAVELLPVSLDFESQVTMGFPILLAAAMLFPPWAAMAIAGIGSIEVNHMRKKGYPAEFSVGLSASSSLISPIMPPSIPAVVYASVAAVSTGALFAAAVMATAAPFLEPGENTLLLAVFMFIPAIFGIIFASLWLLASDIFENVEKRDAARAFSKIGAATLAGELGVGFHKSTSDSPATPGSGGGSLLGDGPPTASGLTACVRERPRGASKPSR